MCSFHGSSRDRQPAPRATPNAIPGQTTTHRSPGRREAALFSQEDFPKVQFGHRFELHIPGGNREASIRLIEQIRGGALRQAMYTHPGIDGAGITWTPWGTPSSEPELEHQRARITPPSLRGGSHVEVPSRAC
jgi:hypothetical protein